MPEWQEIEMGRSAAVELAGEGEYGPRLRSLWTEFDTSDERDRRALQDFMMRPLVSLVAPDGADEDQYFVPGLAIPGVTESWRIVTTIRNHHLGLNPRVTVTQATVSEDDETVYLDLTKQQDPRGKGG